MAHDTPRQCVFHAVHPDKRHKSVSILKDYKETLEF